MKSSTSGNFSKKAEFIGESIAVSFEGDFVVWKTPPSPAQFWGRGGAYGIQELISEWKDFSRQGKFSRNMRATHTARASTRGSRGVGRFYFRVQTEGERIFDIYFDRTGRIDRGEDGAWILLQEINEK